MRDLGFLVRERARDAEAATVDSEVEVPQSAGRRPRTASLREALYRHTIGAQQLDRDRFARAAELISAAIGTGGAPLPIDVRRRLESVIHADLSGVRVYTGPFANAAATELGARAFAVADKLVFSDGAYGPGTSEGDWLLAHEATHAARHRGAPGLSEDVAAEAEASAVADVYTATRRAPEPTADVDRLAIQYGSAIGITRWSLGADRQDTAQRVAALVAHAHGHQCQPGCTHKPRVTPLDDATRAAVERTTDVAVGEVGVERDADLGVPGRLGEARGSTIRLAPEASGDDPRAREVLLHEAIHVAQTRISEDRHANGPVALGATDRTVRVEAEADAAADAAARGARHPLGVKADPSQRYGLDLNPLHLVTDVAKAFGLDPVKFLREHFPQIFSFFQGGLEPLLQKLGDSVGHVIEGALNKLGLEDLEHGFDSITQSFQPGGMAFGILHGCCECLDHALNDLTNSVQKALNSGAGQKIRGWIARFQEADNARLVEEATDFFSALKTFGGPVISTIETAVGWIEKADAFIGHSVVWKTIAPMFGLDPGLPPIEAIKKKLSQLWEKVKSGFAAIQQRLSQLWDTIKQNTVVGEIVKFVDDCGKLIAAIKKVREAKSRDPKVWLGILAKELKGTVFEDLVTNLQSFYDTLLRLKDAALKWFVTILGAVGALAAIAVGVVILMLVVQAIQAFGKKIQSVVEIVKREVEAALDAAAKAIKDLWTTIQPYVNFIVGLAAAIVLTFSGDLFAIPMFVIGELWLHVLPQCYKESLTDFLLNLFIMVVTWFPAKEPIMIFLRSTALSFLNTIKAAPMPKKLTAMDTIAKVMSNDMEVIAGFFVGLLEGLWASSLGFIVQMAIMPFTLAWDLLSEIGKKFGALGGKAFSTLFAGASWLVQTAQDQTGIHAGGNGSHGGSSGSGGSPPGSQPAAPDPAAASASDVTVDPSTVTTSTTGEDTPDGDINSGSSGSPRSGDKSGKGSAEAPDKKTPDGKFDPVPAFPALPPFHDLVDPIFKQGVSRQQIEAMLARFNIIADQWGKDAGKQAADKVLAYLTTSHAPYDVGKLIGEVVGFVAGEVIMLVATDGIENAIAKVVEGAKEGVEIAIDLIRGFPKVEGWITKMQKYIDPLIELVEDFAGKAKSFLQKVQKWLEDMLAWVKRQWKKLTTWLEDTLGIGRKTAGAVEAEIEAEIEAEAAANFAFKELVKNPRVASEAVPLSVMEELLRSMKVPHTPDVKLQLHLVTLPKWWFIEATATKGAERAPGVSIGRGGVLWSEEMVPFYSASARSIRHKELLKLAGQQLVDEAKMLIATKQSNRSVTGTYQQVLELSQSVERTYQQQLPIKNTKFLIKLEPIESRHVQKEGYSKTEFIITPNRETTFTDVPLNGGQLESFLGAYPSEPNNPSSRNFKGHFGKVAPPAPMEPTYWNWHEGPQENLYPSGPVTRHPANDYLRFQNAHNLEDLKPMEVPYTFVGGVDTPGAPREAKPSWNAAVDRRIDRVKQVRIAKKTEEEQKKKRDNPGYTPAPIDQNAMQEEAEDFVFNYYKADFPGLGYSGGNRQKNMSDLRLNSDKNWEGHHVWEHSWGGPKRNKANFQYLTKKEHNLFTQWWRKRHEHIQQALFGKKP